MLNMKRTSKRKKCVPNKFDDTICDLNNKKTVDEPGVNMTDNCVDRAQTEIPREAILKSTNKNVDVIADANDDSQLESSNGKFFSYVKDTVTANNDVNRSLFEKPIEVDGDGNEFVVFDDTIINEGCKRWDLTLCGHFVGHQMFINELRYNLRRMWGRKGFKDVVDVTNGVFFMKFFSEEGMESVVNSGPWMVNNKPFFVQKWDIHVCLDKREPTHIPIWVRLCNIPLEAWTTNGISALASRLGKPLIMDNLTAEICKKGVGRVKYARVLVEVPANKCVPDEIEVIYRDKDRVEICRKKIIVKFDWLPLRCSNCCVFGHDLKTCGKIDHEKTEVVNLEKNEKQNKEKEVNDDFTRVRNRKDYGKGKKKQDKTYVQVKKSLNQDVNIQKEKPVNEFVVQEKTMERKDDIQSPIREGNNGMKKGSNSSSPTSSGSVKRAWNVQGEIFEAIKRSTNKYAVLEDQECENQKEAKEGIKTGEIDPGEINDVYCDENGIAQGMFKIGCWNIRGLCTSDKQKEVRKFMEDEKVSICAIIETRIKSKKLQEIGDGTFRQWEWINNMRYCDKGCKIIMGWDSDKVNLNMLHCCKQSILCRIEDKKGKLLVFCFIVYAANKGNERVNLWKELSLYKRIVTDHPWCIMGDMNVTLDLKEHTARGSSMTKDMQDFKDCVNLIKVEDIASSGLFYTWTKNLKKIKQGDNSGILKKLDRVMRNEAFVGEYSLAHAIFLPYLISDHCPMILVMPNTIQERESDNEKVMPSIPSPEPMTSYIDDLDFFNDFENEFPAIVYNDAQTSKSYLLTEPILHPQHIKEFDLNDETSLSEYDEEEQNVLYFNYLFPFNIIRPDDLKSEKDNDNNDTDIIQSFEDNEITHRKIGLQERIQRIWVKPIQHMALPPHEQRYRFLRYEGLEYSDADIADFEARLARIHRRGVHRMPGVGLFPAWLGVCRTFRYIRGPLVNELILEFYSTFRFVQAILDLDTPETLQFQLGGAKRRMS
ncbi:RNA-directed DNA polymerase, eukaryota, reverse transcriptase zinc-binding domain protein [Tanacetum coccineum]|uniref:RNA-directed DNA polymerase, eukaryota, reverse transcriptase zinc-binding domain protein n=1 Tax=Tanacetum coccineum TaxID=301880 RepID=A0ABQ5BP79_9ASTR